MFWLAGLCHRRKVKKCDGTEPLGRGQEKMTGLRPKATTASFGLIRAGVRFLTEEAAGKRKNKTGQDAIGWPRSVILCP
jgi:hypothetical protein